MSNINKVIHNINVNIMHRELMNNNTSSISGRVSSNRNKAD